MPDGRKNNGGHKTAGRKPKAQEQKLIEKLSPLEDTAHAALKKAVEENESWAIKMYFEYMYGKPKQIIETKDITEPKTLTPEEMKELSDDIKNRY